MNANGSITASNSHHINVCYTYIVIVYYERLKVLWIVAGVPYKLAFDLDNDVSKLQPIALSGEY